MMQLPDVPEAQQAHAPIDVRYEDIAQDGRVQLTALATALGAVCWRPLLMDHPLSRIGRQQGIVPILCRLVIEGGDGPVSVARPLAGRGGYQLAHTLDERGEPDRILLNLFAELEGRRGRTHGPPPPDAGAPVTVGRVFAEHVFTRPFAPAGQRRVTRLPQADQTPSRPAARHPWTPPESVSALPADATPLEPEPRLDPAPVVFGLGHTDSNQHVNSLVYPRWFEEASLRRFAELGRSPSVLARHVEVAYRKPCFAGDTLHVRLQSFEQQGRPSTAGAFVPPDGGRAHAYVRMTFEDAP